MERPYKFLDYYGVGDASQFFGRRREIETLLDDIVTARLVVLFAPTGQGKTSLINAGVRPRLQDMGYASFYVRVEYDPLESSRRDLQTFLEEDFSAKQLPQQSAEDLLVEWLAMDFSDQLIAISHFVGKSIVLFFDQFEEFFEYIYYRNPARADEFISEIAKVYRDPDSGVYIVFSMRSEFLHEMDAFRTQIPSIFDQKSNLRLAGLDERQAKEAIVEPARKVGVVVEERIRFEIDPGFCDVLDRGTISEELRDVFDANGLRLSGSAVVNNAGQDGTWRILSDRKLFDVDASLPSDSDNITDLQYVLRREFRRNGCALSPSARFVREQDAWRIFDEDGGRSFSLWRSNGANYVSDDTQRDVVLIKQGEGGQTLVVYENLADIITSDLLCHRTVEPQLLQIVCDTLWKHQSLGCMRIADYQELGRAHGIIIRRLQDDIADFNYEELRCFERLLPELGTEQQTKRVREVVQLADVMDTTVDALQNLAEKLQDLGWLRVRTIEGKVHIEWISDYFARRAGYLIRLVNSAALVEALSPILTDEERSRYSDIGVKAVPRRKIEAFYEYVIEKVARERRSIWSRYFAWITDSSLRNWIGAKLISLEGEPRIVYHGIRESEGMPNDVIAELESHHLIDERMRSGARVYELAFEDFAGPISTSNERWWTVRRRNRGRLATAALFVFVLICFVGLANQVHVRLAIQVSTESERADVAQATSEAQSTKTENLRSTATAQAQANAAAATARAQATATAATAQAQATATAMALKTASAELAAQGKAHFEAQEYEEAEADYREAIELGESATRHVGLGKVYYASNDFIRAAEHFSAAVSLDESNPVYRIHLGEALDKQERPDEALQVFGDVIKMGKENQLAYWKWVDALLSRGRIYQELGRYEDALGDFEEATEIAPRKSEAWLNLGITQTSLKQNVDAVDSFNKVISIIPHSDDNKQIYESIKDEYSVILARDPADFRVGLNYGVTLIDEWLSVGYLFSVDSQFVNELDQGALREPLRAEFQGQGKPLSGEATVSAEEAGSKWKIVDASTAYLIKNENQTLNVYRMEKHDRPTEAAAICPYAPKQTDPATAVGALFKVFGDLSIGSTTLSDVELSSLVDQAAKLIVGDTSPVEHLNVHFYEFQTGIEDSVSICMSFKDRDYVLAALGTIDVVDQHLQIGVAKAFVAEQEAPVDLIDPHLDLINNFLRWDIFGAAIDVEIGRDEITVSLAP